MQHEQHEEWIMSHTWGATAMEQDDSIDQSSDEEEQVTAGEGEPFLEEVEPLDETASSPPTQRIVEGTLVESTLLAPAPPSNPQGEEDGQHFLRALRHWVGQGLLTVLVALLTVLALTPTQPRVMRLFVSLMPAAGATATVTLVTDQVDLHRTYTLLAVPAGVVSPTTSNHQPPSQTQIEARLLAAPALTQQVRVPTTGKGHQPATQAHGWITFYNQAPTAQVIPAGMLLTGSDSVQARVTALLNQEATTHLGRAYVLQGEVTPIVSTVTTVDARQGVVSLQVQMQGTWAYQLSAAQIRALATLVAGTPLRQTRTILLHTQGIHQVSVTSTDWWDDASQQNLPQDPNRIQVVVISWAGI